MISMAFVVQPDTLVLLAFVATWTVFQRFVEQGGRRLLIAYALLLERDPLSGDR